MPAPATPPTPLTPTPTLLLTSRSPRRRDLLREAGIPHEADHPGVEDSELEPGHVSPEAWVAALSYLKAMAGLSKAASTAPAWNSCWALGADTACVKDGSLIGTPRDIHEARQMLRTFRNGTHKVVTGVALVHPATGVRRIFADSAMVSWGSVSDAQIEDYLRTDAWRGKAGAYNLRERIDAGWPVTYEGDPTTVMGLPMRRLRTELARLGLLAKEAA